MKINKIGRILKSYRYLHSLTQSEMADMLGLNRITYLNLENDKTIPHPTTKRRIANALDIKVEDL